MRAGNRSPILTALALTPLAAFLLLAFACSSDDAPAGEASPTAAEVSPPPTNSSDGPAAMSSVAGDWFTAYKRADFDTLAALVEPGSDFCERAVGWGKHCTIDEWVTALECTPENVQSCGDIGAQCGALEDFDVWSGPSVSPCFEMEIVNVRAGNPECREASPTEAANGYGEKCWFPYQFAQRPVAIAGEFADARMCVYVQLVDSVPFVVSSQASVTTAGGAQLGTTAC